MLQVNDLVSNWASEEKTGSTCKASLLASLAALLQHHLLGRIISLNDTSLSICDSCQPLSGTTPTPSGAVVTEVVLRTSCKPKAGLRSSSSSSSDDNTDEAVAAAAAAVHRAPPRKAGMGIFNHPDNTFIVLQLAKFGPTLGISISGDFCQPAATPKLLLEFA